MHYDLEKRTTQLGKDVIQFLKMIRSDPISQPIINQLLRSATSVGANYREANESSSKKDFRNKISISKKEANESRHWLELMMTACPELENEAKVLLKEVNELVLILGTIYRNSN